jgi:antitoxin FitA
MPSIQIKNVPDDVHRVLRRRAAAAGQSLQEYLLAELSRRAATPTAEEFFASRWRRKGGSADPRAVAAGIRAERDGR